MTRRGTNNHLRMTQEPLHDRLLHCRVLENTARARFFSNSFRFWKILRKWKTGLRSILTASGSSYSPPISMHSTTSLHRNTVSPEGGSGLKVRKNKDVYCSGEVECMWREVEIRIWQDTIINYLVSAQT